jgi:hypothetical protein
VASTDGYRKQAEDCRKQAERTTDPVQKKTLLQLAAAWLKLAQHIEAKQVKKP